MSEIKTKYCRKCDTIKTVDNFNRNITNKKGYDKNGYFPSCKDCVKNKNKRAYKDKTLGQEIVDNIEKEISEDYKKEEEINNYIHFDESASWRTQDDEDSIWYNDDVQDYW